MLYNEDNIAKLINKKVRVLTKANRVVSGRLKNRDNDYIELINDFGSVSIIHKCNILRLCEEGDFGESVIFKK